jgi:tRNA A-37 threonylcarbamoyl transferase component Bud32
MQNLRAMHAIHFVHMDIKKSNIAFSHTFGKYVFIDFGLSELIRECQQ